MSITFEFSFNASEAFPLLVDTVNRALGTSLMRDGDVASGVLLGMPLVLEQHDMEDDHELNFSDYRYQMWNKTWDGSALRSVQLETLVLASFALRTVLAVTDGMLSYEGQKLLARYALEDGRWCDSSSATELHPLTHLVELQRRLDRLAE